MERLVFWLVSGIALVPLLIISVVLITGRGSFLVAGYNTMKPEEQKAWNEKALSRFVGVLMLVFTVLLAVALLLLSLGSMVFFWVCTALGVAELVLGVLYMNISTRFKNP